MLKPLAVTTGLLLAFLLITACDPGSLVGMSPSSATPTAAPMTATPGRAAEAPAITDTPAPARPSVTPTMPPSTDVATPADTSTPAPTPTVAAAAVTSPTPDTAASPTPAAASPPNAAARAIETVIQQANAEEVQAFTAHDPSVMADTATTAYYQQMLQSYNDMSSAGITAVQLVTLTWGPITFPDATTAQANTTETWITTFSDGSTLQETDPNVYALVLKGGSWLIQDDQHPDSRTLQPQPGTPGAAPTAATPGSAAATPPASVVPPGSSVEQSSNWAGYTATGGTFTAISATWTIPNVSAGSGNTVAADATWVGIGGADSTDLIQAGTQATVQGGRVVYTAWWETLPQAAQTVPLDIAASDSVSVAITQQADGTWQILIRDTTSGQLFQKQAEYDSSLSSAEWIEESPTVGRRTLLPLDDFGTVTFTQGTTVEDGQARSIAQAGGQPISMYSTPGQGRRGGQSGQAGQVLAQPSALGADGASFSVTRTGVRAPVVVP